LHHATFWLVLAGSGLLALVLGAGAQQIYQTLQTATWYQEVDHLRAMNDKLRFSPSQGFRQVYSFQPDQGQEALAPGLATKIDGLLYQVCLILPKCPGKKPTLSIYLLKDSNQVRQREQLFSPFRAALSPTHQGLAGLFVARANTVYLSLEDLRVGVLAHEMTHFMLCQFTPPPAAQVQEKWSQYVEMKI
jgi:hypothetical protein